VRFVAPRFTGIILLALGLATSGRLAAQQGTTAAPPDPAQAAQPGARQGQPPQGAPPALGPTPLEVQQMFDALVLYRAQGALQLTNDQYPVFFRSMQQLQNVRRRHVQERRRLINELNRLTQPLVTTDEVTLVAKTKALDDLEAQMVLDEQKALEIVDATLTARQRARFRVFEENMENEKLKLLAQVLKPGPNKTPSPLPTGRK
jgi:hypothetical protein